MAHSRALAAPAQIGPYDIVEEVGAGGMAVVYRAAHRDSGELVALKTVRVPEEVMVRGIRREVQALARIRHPGIVRILSEGLRDGLPWYAMELLEGQTLRAWASAVDEQTRPVDQAITMVDGSSAPSGPSAATRPAAQMRDLKEVVTVVRRLCDALAYLHGEGIVHRDLKPENVLIRSDGSPVLVDFGVVTRFGGRVSRESLASSRAGSEGTLSYMAPEQIRGHLVDARADLYALGCTLYELVTGAPPFTGHFAKILYDHTNTDPVPPSQKIAGLPAEIDALVLRLLAKAPRDRFGFAADVARQLGALGAAPASEPGPSPKAYLYRPGFAGRRGLLAQLEDQVDALCAGTGGLALVGGESGVGKTRLVIELARAAGDDVEVVFGECERDSTTPLSAFVGPLRFIADRCRARGREATDELLGLRGPLLAPYCGDIATLPGQSACPAPPPLPPKQSLERLFRNLGMVLSALAKAKPVLLVLDDLQWADELTIGALLSLCAGGWFDECRVLVMATYRTEAIGQGLQQLLASPGVRSVAVDRLDDASVGAMVADMLAIADAPDDFVARIAEHSEGNPFFVAEYLRLAVDQAMIQRSDDGHWQLTTDAAESWASLPMPRSLQEVVVRRLEGLSRAALQVLAAAAVLARSSDAQVVARMVSLDEDAFLGALDELVRRHVLSESTPGQLRFEHDKLRELTYGRLDARFVEQLHLAAAEAIRAVVAESGASLDDVAADLAYHYRRTSQTARAVTFSRLAGQVALRRNALAAAHDHLAATADLLRSMPQSADRDAEIVDVCLELFVPGSHLYTVADDRVLAICDGARALAEQGGRPKALASLLTNISSCRFGRGEFREAIETGERCLALAESTGDLTMSVQGAFVLTICRYQAGHLAALDASVPALLGRIEAEGATTERFDQMYPPYILMAGVAASAYGLTGRFDEGARLANKGIEAGQAYGHQYGLGIAHLFACWFHAFAGDLGNAIGHGQRCLAIGATTKLPAVRMMAGYALGLAQVLAGDAAAAEGLLLDALGIAERIGYKSLRVEGQWGMAQARFTAGANEDARQWCERALEASRRWGERKLDGDVHRLLGEIELAAGDVASARTHLQSSLQSATEMGAAWFEARARLSRARLSVAVGDRADAQGHLELALNHLRRMKPNPLLFEAEAALLEC